MGNKLDCHEVRLEEIVNTCTICKKKYWKTQKNNGARKRRTRLFDSENFKNRGKHVHYMTYLKNMVLSVLLF